MPLHRPSVHAAIRLLWPVFSLDPTIICGSTPDQNHNVRQHTSMVAKKRPADRLPNPRDELQRAIQRAERGLAAATAEGFREVLLRVRHAVLLSERLVVVLDRLVLHGFRRRQSTEPLAPSDVEPAIQAVRVAVGSLAATTPLKFSADYKRYTERVEALIEVARVVVDRGVESSVNVAELDEWKLFREP